MSTPRHALTDAQFERIKELLPGKATDRGVTANDNRLFVDAILFVKKTGTPWRDTPERFGKWNSVYTRFNRWSKAGVWQRIAAELIEFDLEELQLDSTVVRAHQHAAGQKKRPPMTPRSDAHAAD